MKKKCLLFLLFLGCFIGLSQTQRVYAAPEPDENKVVIRTPTTDVDTIYENYKDNSFELMTQEKTKESFTGIKEAITNASATIKDLTWAGVKGLGQFNATMVEYLFSMDVVTPIRKPMQELTSSIASNMLSIAGTIGIAFVTLIMGIKFMGEQRFRQAIRVFCMTILIFTGLAVCKDANTADSLFNQMFDVDKQIEAAFVKINPVLNGESVQNVETIPAPNGVGPEQEVELSADERMKSAGELIASRVFYTNVYEPYLLMNYGTSNTETIRNKKVTYKDTEYDRINILLDNDVTNDTNITLHEEVTTYEADELNNRSIMYFENWKNAIFGIFYIVVNLIQTIVYFVLCFLRLVISVMQVFLLPLLPILLFAGLFITAINVFANYFKSFGITIFLKAMTGFACIFFATFLSLGFQLSNGVDNPWQKILTIIIYLLTPVGLYIFRTFFKGLFTGQVSLGDAVAFATHPFSTEKRMRNMAKEQRKANRDHRKDAKKQRKAALKKKQEAAQNRGKPELGMKQKPVKESGANRSALRRELKPKAQHKAPNSMEKAQQGMQNLHEKGRQQEAKEQQQHAELRQRKAYDKENLQTAAALAALNQNMKTDSSPTGGKTEVKGDQKATQLRQSNRRTGQSSKGRSERPQSGVRRQGQRQTGNKSKHPTTGTKQRPETVNRSAIRNQHRANGQKAENTSIVPKGQSQTRGRSINRAGATPRRQQASVRQKMEGVQQVIKQQTSSNQAEVKQITPSVEPPITRVSKRTTPPVKSKKAKNGSAIRRTTGSRPAQQTTNKSPKGVNRPRARK